MECFNTTTLGLLVDFVITAIGFGQTGALASPMVEAIFVNGFGLSRAYRRRTVTEGVPTGLLPLRDIELGASKLSLLYMISGQTGPNHRRFVHLYFRSTGTVTQ